MICHDLLTLTLSLLQVYGEGMKPWLIPELHGDNSGTKLSGYIKGMQKKGGLQRYKDVAVEDLPENPTAGGIRPGAADTLASHVPAELAVHNTGHDLTGLAALWEYLNARAALLVPGVPSSCLTHCVST